MASLFLSRGHIEKIGDIFVDFCGRSDKRNESFVLDNLGRILQKQGRLKEAEEIYLKIKKNSVNHESKKRDFVLKKGTVKWITKHHYGYLHGRIASEDGSEDIYFREGFIDSTCLYNLKNGDYVEVGVEQGPIGPRATYIILI